MFCVRAKECVDRHEIWDVYLKSAEKVCSHNMLCYAYAYRLISISCLRFASKTVSTSTVFRSIFITGSSGYIGSALISHAIASGYTVATLSCTPENDAKLPVLQTIPICDNLKTLKILICKPSKAGIATSIAGSIASKLFFLN